MPKEREGTARVTRNWPTEGKIEFKKVLFQDREISSKKPLNFVIKSGEKIGKF